MLSACVTRPGSPITISGKVLTEGTTAEKQNFNSKDRMALDAIKKFKGFLSEHNIRSGAIAISYNGKPIGSHGINRLVTEPTPVASLSKAITAVCAKHALEENGKTLNSNLGSLFPEFFRSERVADQRFQAITVQQLMSHTSGIRAEDVVVEAYRRKNIRKEHNQWIFNKVAARALNTSPGKKFFYDNAGYAILGLIISNLSNQPYSQ